MDAEASARLHAVELQVAALQDAVRGFPEVVAQLRELHADFLRRQGAAEARAHHDEQLLRVPGRLDAIERRLMAVEQREAPEERPAPVRDETSSRPRIWESDEGRRVLWWGIVGAVLCCLAIGGGLSFGELVAWWGHAPTGS